MRQKDTRQILKTGFSGNKNIIILSDENLEKLKSVLLEMLQDTMRVLERYSLSYTLSGGSALGAIRHQGFIPWDDDIDINIPRKDYNKLLKIFDKELGHKYKLCSPEKTCNHGMLCAQIKKRGTLYRSFNELSKNDADCGICMDIFVVENTYNYFLLRKLHGCLCLAAGYMSTCRKTYEDFPFIEKYLISHTDAEKAFRKKAKIGGLFRFLPLDKVTKWAVRCYSICRNDKSIYVTIPSGRRHFFGEIQLRSDLCETTNVLFENITVKNPKGYDIYLKSLYGKNYMQLPPIEKRESHPLMAIDFGMENKKTV